MDGRWHGSRPDLPERLRRWFGDAGKRTRSTQVVGVMVGVVAVVLVVAIAISALGSLDEKGHNAAITAGDGSGAAAQPSSEPSVTPPSSASPSPSKSKKDEKETPPADDPPPDDGQGGDEPEPDPEPTKEEPKIKKSTPPTDFDAWKTGEGKYAANWEWPVSDGGSTITGYVLRECDGTKVIEVGAATYAIEFNHPYLDCLTVQAINGAGEGEKAYETVAN